MDIFLRLIELFCGLLAFIIFLRAILSWFPISPYNPIVVFLNQITEPFLAPLRRVIPRIGMVDITPMVAILILLLTAALVGSI
jgi:YggT family protein